MLSKISFALVAADSRVSFSHFIENSGTIAHIDIGLTATTLDALLNSP